MENKMEPLLVWCLVLTMDEDGVPEGDFEGTKLGCELGAWLGKALGLDEGLAVVGLADG
jgi:hypothetical protein